MRFGFCASYEQFSTIARAGFDYFEPALAPNLKPSSKAFDVMPALLAIAAEQPIAAEAFNVFLPGDLKVTGPAIDPIRQQRYLESAFQRVAALGGKIVVFGSGGARMVSDGFAHEEANRQLVAFLTLAGPIAEANRVTIVIEPLNHEECNIVNSVAEATELADAVSHPCVQVLSDLYHVNRDGQSFEETRAAGLALRHVHVAGREARRAPIAADIDYLAPFFSVLKQIDYRGRISVEGNVSRVEEDAPVALEVCRKAWELA